MKPNQSIFCNTPWYELHIYWDGGLGICCQESHKLYAANQQQYNIATMSIRDWFNSEPVKQFRSGMLGNTRLSPCRRCYDEEQLGNNSRRLKSNQKSVIFTRTAFEQSFQQSPGYRHFELSDQQQGLTDTMPIDLHIDLGNFCNLACKMCSPRASSTIASQHVRWGIEDSKRYLGQDWTRNNDVWHSFKNQLLDIPNLKNIHFMGGETLLTDRIEDLVDHLTVHQRFDICLSFVSNGTVFDPELVDKLSRFRRVGIEISIETLDNHNSYVRQGTDTQLVLENIRRFQQWCNGTSTTVAIRPSPSLLTIGYYHELLKFCIDNQFIIKSNFVFNPRFLSVEILPEEIKKKYLVRYQKLWDSMAEVKTDWDYNASNPHNHLAVAKEQTRLAMELLQTPTPADSEQQLAEMVRHCERWDGVYGLDARTLYPEFQEILDRHGYNLSR